MAKQRWELGANHNQETDAEEARENGARLDEEKCADTQATNPNMNIRERLALKKPKRFLKDVFFNDKGEYSGQPVVVLRGLGSTYRERIHRAVGKTELDSLSVYDCGERVLVVGTPADVSREIWEINFRNGRAPKRLLPDESRVML